MQITIEKKFPVTSPVDASWKILADINALTACMPGAELTDKVDERNFKGQVRVKVGPATAAFAGTIEVQEIDGEAKRIAILGKGADRGGSSASMHLTVTIYPTEGGASELHGVAEVTVNGKFAQFGGRMMNSVADMILVQFAENFASMASAVGSSDTAANPPSKPDATPRSASPKELNGLSFLWGLVKRALGRLFGKHA